MKRKIMSLTLALSLVFTLCACSGDADGDATLFGRGILYTRTASDEEAFSHLRETQAEEELDLEDEAVPLSGLPVDAEPEQASEKVWAAESSEGWMLVRYATNENGEAEPMWYRVWTEENGWSGENLLCECQDWHPVIPD